MRINSIRTVSPIINTNYSTQSRQNMLFVPTNSDTVSFAARINHDIPAQLAESLQQKMRNIHNNIDFIKEFFGKYSKSNPQLAAKIRREYSDLVPRRRSGVTFKLADSENTVDIMQCQTRSNVLFININDGSSEYNGIITDGYDKLIANYFKNHPHMLPRKFRYMDEGAIKETEPEKFIDIADKKLNNYADYLRQIETNKLSMSKEERALIKSHAVKKTDGKISEQKGDNEPVLKIRETFAEHIEKKSKNIVSKITRLLNGDVKKFPEYLTPKLAPSGKPLGFTLQTDDGGTLKVMRKAIGIYKSSMPYLSFEKTNPDNTFNFISIDMISNKILKMRDKGKPYIVDDIVSELSVEEIKKRKFEDKLDYYMSQIFKEQSKPVTEIAIEQPAVQKAVNKPTVRREAEKVTIDNDIESLKQNMRELGKKNGSIAANEYFNSFKEQFILEIQQKMAEFNSSFQKFIDSVSK